ncbi:hypothetical protein T440DRAFT_487597 [Plenodomus tracheiphilus IPT5]|uniref:RGS domain-containing protein n=1 Tax=Plenodomus tracheiphilus IPT5 TaxID=1408161 RepID=A0A6A7BCX9_9PLEO|nr:hypothetical protein T440DRAFT_487597 [Plenodomus tracheiphilus IPT5]
MGLQLKTDRIAWTYTSVAIVWNLAIVAALSFLWTHRSQPSLRIRRLPLLFAGILSLHTYGCFVLFLYMMGSNFTCNAEFWIMSIYLPLGIALFHASNSQFLHLASRQKQFAHMSLKEQDPISEKKAQTLSRSRWRKVISGAERADNIERTLIYISIGLAVQFAITLFVFLGSRKFHSFGFFDYTVAGTDVEQREKCSKGWEWWLSIVWQFFWSWIYAPYCLWKSRGINDVHHWRIQTICCCIAGLPASPLWLAALYAPAFESVNEVFPPPVWFSICIFMMEVFAIGFPIADVLKGISLHQETLEAIANWEARRAANGFDSDATEGSFIHHPLSTATTLKSSDRNSISKTSFESQKSDMLTMNALENALRTNAVPLLRFASMKDFSGENVSFLTNLADWRRYWLSAKLSSAQHRHDQFIAATRIYAHFVSDFSEFPINISSKEKKRLQNVFEDAANLLYRHKRGSLASATSDNATPFDNILPTEPKNSFSSTTELQSTVNLDALGRANFRAVSSMREPYIDEVLTDIEVHEDFKETVFDAAESEIKYLVLTNTWPKFVNLGHASSQMSKNVDTERGNAWAKKILCSS